VIDWNRVRELRQEVGADDFRDVVDIFLEELDETMARLVATPAEMISEDDIHFLKGCALNLGFRRVSTLCHELESKSADGSVTGEDAKTLLQACAASKSAFLDGADLAA
jgi:HPt (histidine-containing phosphotransfer) domain-containing protein